MANLKFKKNESKRFIFYKNGETKGIRYEKQLAYEHLEGFMFDEGFNKV